MYILANTVDSSILAYTVYWIPYSGWLGGGVHDSPNFEKI
jgi:hypothetical protein